MKRITLFLAAVFAATALAEEPKLLHPTPIGTHTCDESKGQVWTCTIQCDPGVRSSNDMFPRIMPNNAGVEVCAVRQCTCAANMYWRSHRARPGHLAQDTTNDLVMVVFGVDRLLGN